MSVTATTSRPLGDAGWIRAFFTRATSMVRWTAWGCASFVALTFLAQPVSAGAQLALSLGVIGLMSAIWLLAPRNRLVRSLFLALGSLVVVRYVYWRATGTLPPFSDPLSFGIGFLLLLAELYCVLILAISLIINADPLVRAPPPFGDATTLPTVDIFIPTYNEDEYILATTIAAAKSIEYPPDKLTVWLLDDGGSNQKCNDRDPAKAAVAKARRESLTQLCADLGARYLTRAKNEHAKAGNLNNGLKFSTGEIVVVFDADHAPFRSFLRETIGHFALDPKLFLVQTPHVFLNPDPIEKNLKTFDRMPSENEMFYGVTQRGLDKWNGSFFCGSAALLRREALATTGGFSGITITEDCETAFELHANGWTSVYVDKPLIAGLQPETFESFIGQRSRWCQGMFQIMMLKNPALKSGLAPIQRLAYLSSMTFWFFPLPRLAFMMAPLLHIFFDVKIFVSSIDEAIAYTATYVVVNMMVQNYLYGHVRWPWVSELYEYVQGVYLAKAIASVVWSPRKPTFNVTAKGISMEEEHLSSLAKPFLIIFGLLASGVITAGWRYLYEPGVTNLMLVVGLWSLFNLIIAGAALGAVAERPQVERIPGLGVARHGSLTLGGDTVALEITRVSPAGCTARIVGGSGIDFERNVGLARLAIETVVEGRELPTLPALVGAGAANGELSLAFVALAPREYLTIADLMYGDASAIVKFLASRRKHKNLLAGSARFIAWGVTEPVRALRYASLEMRRKRAAAKRFAPPAPASAPLVEVASVVENLAMQIPSAELLARLAFPVPAAANAVAAPSAAVISEGVAAQSSAIVTVDSAPAASIGQARVAEGPVLAATPSVAVVPMAAATPIVAPVALTNAPAAPATAAQSISPEVHAVAPSVQAVDSPVPAAALAIRAVAPAQPVVQPPQPAMAERWLAMMLTMAKAEKDAGSTSIRAIVEARRSAAATEITPAGWMACLLAMAAAVAQDNTLCEGGREPAATHVSRAA